MELPLGQPETAEVCRAAEEAGFFFSGLGPAFAGDGDVLLMQFLAEDLDLSLIEIENPFAKDLLATWAANASGFRTLGGQNFLEGLSDIADPSQAKSS